MRLASSRHPFIAHFQRKVGIDFEKGIYRVKTVESREELEQVLQLRYEIFHREFQNKKFPVGIDVEDLDAIGDHLVIIDRRIEKIVGTYRLISSSYSPTFYSESEFQLGEFLKRKGIKLELSRAGVHKDYRDGVVMNLLWRGVAQYLEKVEAQYLFGCASIKTTSVQEAKSICEFLRLKNYLLEDLPIEPTGKYKLPGFWMKAAETSGTEIGDGADRGVLPPLFAAYLRMGAKVGFEPALDRAFQCIDFLTILNVEDMRRPYEKRYRS